MMSNIVRKRLISEAPVLCRVVQLGSCGCNVTRMQLHTDGPMSGPVRPVTVSNNVKFSKLDPLERKFKHFYPDLIHLLSHEIGGSTPGLSSQFTKVLTHNLSEAVVGKRYGLMVPRSYKELGGEEEQEQLAIVLGWAVELTRAANNLTAEITNDRHKSRNGRITWHRKSGLGSAAINHVQMINSCVFILLNKFFSHFPSYNYILHELLEALSHQSRGFCLDLNFQEDQRKPQLQSYDIPRYKQIVYSTRTFPTLVFPISLALHLAGLHQAEVHVQARNILTDIGHFSQVRQDFDNCFKDPKEGDIAKGRVTWLIVLARQRASPSQLKELEACYGRQEEECVQRVKQIYYELKINKNVPKYIDDKISDIERSIQGMAKVDKLGLSQSLFFKILSEVVSDQYTFLQTSSFDTP